MLRDSRAALNDLSAKTLRDSRGAPNDLLDVKIMRSYMSNDHMMHGTYQCTIFQPIPYIFLMQLIIIPINQ